MRATGTSATRPSACAVTAATRRSAASGDSGSSSTVCSALMLASDTSPVALTTVRSSFERAVRIRSEEHTSELQSQSNLVCRLLLEKKKKKKKKIKNKKKNTERRPLITRL